MMNPISFYFDYISPYAYLAWLQIQGLAAAHGRTVPLAPVTTGSLRLTFPAVPKAGPPALLVVVFAGRELFLPLPNPSGYVLTGIGSSDVQRRIDNLEDVAFTDHVIERADAVHAMSGLTIYHIFQSRLSSVMCMSLVPKLGQALVR